MKNINSELFLNRLKSYTLENCFNPYTMVDTMVDLVNADQIRSVNLVNYLNQLQKTNPTEIWVGEALGHRGGKCSGLPFTDVRQISEGLGSQVGYRLPTKELISEVSAQTIQEVIKQRKKDPVLWNIFPFHPHKPNDIHSNRAPSKNELQIGFSIFQQLIQIFPDAEVISIGRKAESTLRANGIESNYVRHPSRGGAKLFKKQLLKLAK